MNILGWRSTRALSILCSLETLAEIIWTDLQACGTGRATAEQRLLASPMKQFGIRPRWDISYKTRLCIIIYSKGYPTHAHTFNSSLSSQ